VNSYDLLVILLCIYYDFTDFIVNSSILL